MQVDYFCLLEQGDVWYEIADLAKRHGLTGGVYRVHGCLADTPPVWDAARIQPVSRVLKDDLLGRLYIGKATNFQERFVNLRKALHPRYSSSDGHGVGRLFAASPGLRERFPNLGFSLCFADNPRAVEMEELAHYRVEFGEPPPLNTMS